MGGDLSAVVPSASRRPRTSKCLVKAGSLPVQIATPAFQPTPGLPRLTTLSFSSSRLGNVNKFPLLSLAASVPSPVIRYLINDFGKIVGYLTLSPQAHALASPKSPYKTSASKAVRRLALRASGIRRLTPSSLL